MKNNPEKQRKYKVILMQVRYIAPAEKECCKHVEIYARFELDMESGMEC